MRHLLFRLLGLNTAVMFGVVSALFVGVLTSLYLTSGYAIEIYTSDQMKRIPWDVSLGQKDLVANFSDVSRMLGGSEGVGRAETFGMLRVQNGQGVELLVDGKPISSRWLGIVGTSDPALLPPPLKAAPARCRSDGAVCAHVGTVGSRGADSLVLPIVAGSRLQLVKAGHGVHAEESRGAPAGGHSHEGGAGAEWAVLSRNSPNLLIDLQVAEAPAQIDRSEFNKDMLRRQGSLTYLPDLAVLAVVPMEEFERIAILLDGTFLSAGGMHGGASAPPYVPQVDHLLKLERERFIVPFHIVQSLDRVIPRTKSLLASAHLLTPFVDARSDLATVLGRMHEIENAIGFVTLLVAIPLLWLGWTVANMLIELLLLSDRRKIGLLLVRGIPMRAITRTISGALIAGGLIGSLVGLAFGILLPIIGYKLAGVDAPPFDFLTGGLLFFLVYFLLGSCLSAFVGWRLMRRVRRLTPKQASARQAAEFEAEAPRRVTFVAIACALCVVLGGYKIISLILSSQHVAGLAADQSSTGSTTALDSVLTLLAIPLLLIGIIGLLRLRPNWMGRTLSAVTRPMAGPRLSAFVAHHMVVSRHRIGGVMFVAALATALVIVPQVARDSFNDRIGRGVEMSVGGDVQLEFDLAEIAQSEDAATVADFESRLSRPITEIRQTIARQLPNAGMNILHQYVVPGFFVPDQTGLALTLIENPATYLKDAPHTASLGLTRPFSTIISDLSGDKLPVSHGLLKVRRIHTNQPIIIDYHSNGAVIRSQFSDVFAFLPGQPTLGVDQHKGFALAEIDYVNTIMASDARAAASASSFARGELGNLEVTPSRLVVLLRTGSAVNEPSIRKLVAALPVKPQSVRWVQKETEAAGKDMFVSLAIENMKVFLVGGLILAITGIVAVNIVNFRSERRTFGLVRLRGASPADMVRILLAFFLSPVLVGVLMGGILGVLSGFATSQAIWNMPRIFGVAGLLPGHLSISPETVLVTFGFGLVLLLVALLLAVAPLRYSTSKNIRES